MRCAIAAAALIGTSLVATAAPATAATATSAWSGTNMSWDIASVVSRSDIILQRANKERWESLPLGNGRLGVAAWSPSQGPTFQVNRSDLYPQDRAVGELVIPSLAGVTTSTNFSGRLNLYDAVLRETGGGVTVETRVLADRDAIVVDLSGLPADSQQTAELRLWDKQPTGLPQNDPVLQRNPSTTTSGPDIAAMSETWSYNNGTAGFVGALTAKGRNVSASSTQGTRTVRVTFQPNTDGTARVVLAAPYFTGGDPATAARNAVGTTATDTDATLRSGHNSFWHDIWARAGYLKMTSSNGEAEYLENLRQLAIYTAAAGDRNTYPMNHGGVANLFKFNGDYVRWDGKAFWHWNMRQQVDLNRSAGAFKLNDPYYRLYRQNLAKMITQTFNEGGGTERGACIHEVVFAYGDGTCHPYSPTGQFDYQIHIFSTGAEVGLNIWREYQYTRNLTFLKDNYPVMKAAAQFLLDHSKLEGDGKRHMNLSHARETWWDTRDPATDLAGMKAFFPVAAQAADLNSDSTFANELRAAVATVPDFATKTVNGKTVIAPHSRDVPQQNQENVELEPIWPYGVIGDRSGVWTDRAKDTFVERPFPQYLDWSSDAIQAARLGLADQVRALTLVNTDKFQTYISGYSRLISGYNAATNDDNPYYEWNGYLGVALHEALVQRYDGLLRIAPAWPSTWDVDAQLYVEGGHVVGVQMRSGSPVTVGIKAGSTENIQIKNPWGNASVRVVTSTGTTVVADTTAGTLTAPVTKGTTYYVERTATPTSSLPFEKVTGTRATAPKTYGTRSIGLAGSAGGGGTQVPLPISGSYNDDAIATLGAITDGDFSGGYKLAAETYPPAGTSTQGGVLWDFGPTTTGSRNNIKVTGQTIALPTAPYTKIHLLAAAAFGPVDTQVTLTYSDNSTSQTMLSVPDWVQGGTANAAVTMAYRYTPTAQQNFTTRLYDLTLTPTIGKSVTSITMSTGGTVHVFAITGETA